MADDDIDDFGQATAISLLFPCRAYRAIGATFRQMPSHSHAFRQLQQSLRHGGMKQNCDGSSLYTQAFTTLLDATRTHYVDVSTVKSRLRP